MITKCQLYVVHAQSKWLLNYISYPITIFIDV